MTQHAGLSAGRWAQFSLAQQILMIANEMVRGTAQLAPDRAASRVLYYERVLRLVDLTVEVQPRRTLRRELLRWRGLVAELFLDPDPQPERHRAALRCLLQLHPEAARQIRFVCPEAPPG